MSKKSILNAVHETVEGLYDNSIVDSKTIKEFDKLCLTPDEEWPLSKKIEYYLDENLKNQEESLKNQREIISLLTDSREETNASRNYIKNLKTSN